MTLTGRLAYGLAAINLAALVILAAAAVRDGSWSGAAASLPADALPVSELARRAENRGVDRISRIEVEGKDYRVEGVDGAGRRVELRVDPVSGDIIK